MTTDLPDPLEWADGSGKVANLSQWEKRRNEIGRLIQQYEIGTKPTVSKKNIKAWMKGDSLFVTVKVKGKSLTLSTEIRYPKGGHAPYALMIGINSNAGSLPYDLFRGKNIATATFHSAQVNPYMQNTGQTRANRKDYPFTLLYPELMSNGAYVEWAWGVSRLIDGLEIAGEQRTKIDTKHIGITGCSYAGKMALFCGAFDERIALTIAQEPGGGGAAAWRTSYQNGGVSSWNPYLQKSGKVETLERTDENWFKEGFTKDFAGDKVYSLPYDHHELCAMVCPRALLVLGNPDYVWLADRSAYVSVNAAKKVWEKFGIADRIGYSFVGGHQHCMLPESQYDDVGRFIDKFLLGDNTVNTDSVCVAAGLPENSVGGMATGKYRNLFAEYGYKQSDIDAKVQEAFDDVFTGPNKVYFEVGDSMGYISDVKNHDVRTEGMSYGMMIAVQFERKDIFDRLWRWSKKYMQNKSGASEGYFTWTCKTDGTSNSFGSASDGELYYITSLIFASNRWGNDGDINYLKEAQYILNCSMQKVGMDFVTPLINIENRLITFTPDKFGGRYTDPSYHLPAFYEVWALWAEDGRAEFWKDCARKSREFLHKCINPKTGLNPDYCNYDGTSLNNGRTIGDAFRFDSWRVPMNIALDYSWSCADKEWQQQYANTFQNFLFSQGIDTYVDQYNVDGSPVKEILQAGDYPKALRHSLGLVSTAAAASLIATHDKAKDFVDRLWNAKHEPYPDGFYDGYYDGLLHLFAIMHLSGRYRVISGSSDVPF